MLNVVRLKSQESNFVRINEANYLNQDKCVAFLCKIVVFNGVFNGCVRGEK